MATELVSGVLDEIRDSGKRITIICSAVGEFIARNPEYLDFIDILERMCNRADAQCD